MKEYDEKILWKEILSLSDTDKPSPFEMKMLYIVLVLWMSTYEVLFNMLNHNYQVCFTSGIFHLINFEWQRYHIS